MRILRREHDASPKSTRLREICKSVNAESLLRIKRYQLCDGSGTRYRMSQEISMNTWKKLVPNWQKLVRMKQTNGQHYKTWDVWRWNRRMGFVTGEGKTCVSHIVLTVVSEERFLQSATANLRPTFLGRASVTFRLISSGKVYGFIRIRRIKVRSCSKRELWPRLIYLVSICGLVTSALSDTTWVAMSHWLLPNRLSERSKNCYCIRVVRKVSAILSFNITFTSFHVLFHSPTLSKKPWIFRTRERRYYVFPEHQKIHQRINHKS